MKYFIGIDIGGTKCAVTITGENMSGILCKLSFPTNQPRGWRMVVDDIIKSVRKIIENICADASEVLAAGISCGGPLDSKKGVIMCPPNLPDWENIEICRIISDEFGFPVFLQNDANACALAEWKFGAGKGCMNMIFLTFGTGMGAGLILDGKLYSGTNDMAGEVGHIRLEDDGPEGYCKKGSFEGFCSGGGIERFSKSVAEKWLFEGKKSLLFSNKDDIDKLTAKSVAQAAYKGDEFAEYIYKICGEKLGKGLSIIIDLLNPECIVIGSIFTRSGDLLARSMKEVLENECLKQSLNVCKIKPAELGESIGDYAAIGVAVTGYERITKNA